MQTWFTSDLHLGHNNIIRYCARPFSSVDEMDEALVQRWNETVADEDRIWVLGDFALGDIGASLALTSTLRGRKILLAGNHDRCWAGTGKKTHEWTERYLEAGFDEVLQGEQTMSIVGEQVRLCHFPYEGDSHDHDRFVGNRPIDDGGWLLHGHVHERWRQRQRMINVGVDVNDFCPVSIDEIAQMIAAGPVSPATGPSVSSLAGHLIS
ncbi:MAG TPA: hypothetical protein VL068_01110, partial [Microthrixaceae bacterium]|nr:hypothetical protein [Microthrixaceae bacterium]